jgi:tetratricopeptide (TPR) repeat protein
MRLAVLCLALCLAPPVGAVDMGLSEEADLGPARAAIEAEDWAGALALLEPIVAEDADNADALNLMGYAARNAGDLDRAASYYRAALIAEPEHLGALEYQGELFLMQGDRAGAEANLARLTELCGACEEREELAAALAEGS